MDKRYVCVYIYIICYSFYLYVWLTYIEMIMIKPHFKNHIMCVYIYIYDMLNILLCIQIVYIYIYYMCIYIYMLAIWNIYMYKYISSRCFYLTPHCLWVHIYIYTYMYVQFLFPGPPFCGIPQTSCVCHPASSSLLVRSTSCNVLNKYAYVRGRQLYTLPYWGCMCITTLWSY